MPVALYASNEITIVSSMVCCWAYLYKQRWRYLKPRPLVATTILVVLTVLTYGLQLAYPEVLHAFRRDAAAMRSGEWWRLITPLFVQPWGVTQFGFNMLFLGVFLPMGERIYGARIWLLYFVPGLVGQFVNFWWDPHGGGSSPAIFGVIGSVLTYVLGSGGSLRRCPDVLRAIRPRAQSAHGCRAGGAVLLVITQGAAGHRIGGCCRERWRVTATKPTGLAL